MVTYSVLSSLVEIPLQDGKHCNNTSHDGYGAYRPEIQTSVQTEQVLYVLFHQNAVVIKDFTQNIS